MGGFADSKTLAPVVAAIALCGAIGGWQRGGGRELTLAAAAGLSWLARVAARLPLVKVDTKFTPPVLIIVLLGALSVRPQWVVRRPDSRPGNLRQVAAVIDVNERPGDVVIYVPSRLRASKYAYPGVWARLRDLALARSPAASASNRARLCVAVANRCQIGLWEVR